MTITLLIVAFILFGHGHINLFGFVISVDPLPLAIRLKSSTWIFIGTEGSYIKYLTSLKEEIENNRE